MYNKVYEALAFSHIHIHYPYKQILSFRKVKEIFPVFKRTTFYYIMFEITSTAVILTVLKQNSGTGDVVCGTISVLGENGSGAVQIISHLEQTVCHP